jgi:hypothetical protein
MKKNLILLIGIAILAFAVLAYAGNFLQWSSATQVTAKITNTTEQAIRKGENMVKLNVQYPVGNTLMTGTVTVTASTMGEAVNNNEIEVYYMNKKPERVVPVVVLKNKQKAVPILASVGVILTIVGFFLRVRKNSGAS